MKPIKSEGFGNVYSAIRGDKEVAVKQINNLEVKKILC